MSEFEQVSDAVKTSVPFATRALALLGIRWRGNQAHQNRKADVDAIKELEASGIPVAYFKGPALEVEAFQHVSDAEAERLALNVLNAGAKAYPPDEWDKVDWNRLSPEFLRRWTFEASNVADETLQDLWGKLLKGELDNPDSVSNDTMTVLRDMNKARAEEFRLLCSAALYNWDGSPSIVVSCGSPGNNSLQSYGLSYDALMRLAHHRLIVNDMNSYRTISGSPLGPIFPVRHQGKTWLLQSLPQHKASSSLKISGILFTPAGEELARVVEYVPMPDYTDAMFADLGKQGWIATPVSDDT